MFNSFLTKIIPFYGLSAVWHFRQTFFHLCCASIKKVIFFTHHTPLSGNIHFTKYIPQLPHIYPELPIVVHLGTFVSYSFRSVPIDNLIQSLNLAKFATGKTSCGMNITLLQRTPIYTDGTYLIMVIGHPNYHGYPLCKGEMCFDKVCFPFCCIECVIVNRVSRIHVANNLLLILVSS